ncbi:MAG: phosphoribosylamine--glycine ligase [Alphaproteobacteria bacterium]
MKVLVVGSGGREHALSWAIGASPLCDALYAAPGNAGIAHDATCVPIKPTHIAALLQFCWDEKIDLVVVGPEAPLAAGLVDRLEAEGIKAFGPSAAAARLEASKGFMKDFCARHGIPSADYRRFDKAEEAKDYIREKGAPIVVKTDGLAAGKGVTVAATTEEAFAAVDDAIEWRRFGEAGAEIVVEECLTGTEVSLFALVDGERALELGSAQDYKRVGEGDTGPNTGGMGAISPAPAMTAAVGTQVLERIIGPAVDGLAAEGRPFKGLLYAGLMIGPEGPKLLEFNIRFGDPECQVLMPRLKSDLLPGLVAASEGALRGFDLAWRAEKAVTVVMASKGYPGAYEKGSVIRGLDAAARLENVTVFHAGTELKDDHVIAVGGRVLGITALGDSLEAARGRAYEAIARIDWPEGFCRSDIGA